MTFDKKDIEKIANLAKLAMTEEDFPQYAHNLSNILALVEQMNAVDTQGVVPMAHPLDASQRLREDVITETDQSEVFQAEAPQTEAGLYLVPKVLE